jgi:hypothetical protein
MIKVSVYALKYPFRTLNISMEFNTNPVFDQKKNNRENVLTGIEV